TARLTLRPFVETDFVALRDIESDPEVLRYRSRSTISAEATRETLLQYVAEATDPTRQRFAFASTLYDGGKLIGDSGLTLLLEETGGAFLWYSVNRQYWGNGYASEAAAAVVQFGLRTLQLDHIEARSMRANAASLRVLEKIGMKRDPAQPTSSTDYFQFGV